MTIIGCVLLACLSVVNALTLTACRDGQIDIVHGTQASIKCTGLFSQNNYTWSITTPSTGAERTIGTCESCPSSQCPACDVPDIDYNITRGSADVFTVSFVANETDHHNTTIRCALSVSPPGVTCRIHVIEGYRLSGCFVVENAQPRISCSYRDPTYGMYWSITYLNGTYSTVAECAPCVNDTCQACDVKNTDFRVTRFETSSTLQMVNGSDKEKDGALLKCSRSDNVTAEECPIKVFYYKLPQCDGGQLDVSEVEPWTTVRCEGLRQPQNMNWTITDLNGNKSQIAFCDSKKNCTTNSSDVIVSRENQYSNLTFVGGVREKANLNLTCIKRDGGSQDSCLIRTFYLAETNNTTVGVDSNFTVTGRVYISKVYASDNNITCQWFHSLDNKPGDKPLSNLSLSSFTDTDGLEYQLGHCDMTVSVNSSEITHNFDVLILTSNETVQFAGVVAIESPGSNLTTKCPDYVSEGSDLTCECSHPTAQHGNPPATISWRYVTDTAGLHIRNVSRDMNGTKYVCSSVWGEGRPEEVRSSDNYTMLVAYGPNKATVYVSGDDSDDPNIMTLICTSDVAYPSVNFTWSVACVTFTFTPAYSTCTIDMDRIDVREVVCTAFNAKFPEIYATRSHAFLFNNDPEPEPFPLVVVAVTVGATVLVIIIVIAIVVVVYRRRGGQHDGPSATDSHRENHSVDENPSGDYYLTPVASHTTRHEDQLPYDSLQMSEVGMRSEYSDVGRHGHAMHADT